MVDDFLIKYIEDVDLQHFRDAVGEYYKLKVDLKAKQYVGINLRWNYNKQSVQMSMDGYIMQALLELEHKQPQKGHQPYLGMTYQSMARGYNRPRWMK